MRAPATSARPTTAPRPTRYAGLSVRSQFYAHTHTCLTPTFVTVGCADEQHLQQDPRLGLGCGLRRLEGSDRPSVQGRLSLPRVQMCVTVLTWTILQEYNDTLTQLCTQYNTTCSSYPGVSNCQTCSATSDVSALKQTVPAPHFGLVCGMWNVGSITAPVYRTSPRPFTVMTRPCTALTQRFAPPTAPLCAISSTLNNHAPLGLWYLDVAG